MIDKCHLVHLEHLVGFYLVNLKKSEMLSHGVTVLRFNEK